MTSTWRSQCFSWCIGTLSSRNITVCFYYDFVPLLRLACGATINADLNPWIYVSYPHHLKHSAFHVNFWHQHHLCSSPCYLSLYSTEGILHLCLMCHCHSHFLNSFLEIFAKICFALDTSIVYALKQALLWSRHSAKPARVQEVFGLCPQTQGLILH